MKKTILIIDDDRLVLESLKKLFLQEGYDVLTAESGAQAFILLEKHDPDLIIADIRMPQLDGVQTARKIKEIRRGKGMSDIPIIFITGYADIGINEKAKDLGELVLKPFDLEEFLNFVRQQSIKKRVVITGLGVVAANGIGKDEFWQANIKGVSAVERIKDFDTADMNSKIAAQVKNFEPSRYMSAQIISRTDRFSQLGIAAAKLALEDSKLNLEEEDKDRIGVSIGSGLGGVLFHEEQISTMYEKGFKKAEPLGVPKVAPNAVPGHISIIFG
ncbi:MAG: response regulator, partial [Candidatus Omnitrophica bacterium]|nr:response regulator [Candidatus Omnitrophota bacterium]